MLLEDIMAEHICVFKFSLVGSCVSECLSS